MQSPLPSDIVHKNIKIATQKAILFAFCVCAYEFGFVLREEHILRVFEGWNNKKLEKIT
jgi:hypothetical protein